MTDEISYFDVAAFLADIEPDYERYLDPIEKKARLVLAVREPASAPTASPGNKHTDLLDIPDFLQRFVV